MLFSRIISLFNINFAFLILAISAQAVEWLEVSEEDRARIACEFDENAPAEVLYKSREIDQLQPDNSYYSGYVRLKIYREGALGQVQNQKIKYNSSYQRFGRIDARIIKPNGAIIEYNKADFFHQSGSETDKSRWRQVAFATKDLEVGDIFEYKYRVNIDHGYYSSRIFVDFQERWPIRDLELRVRPSLFGGFRGIKWMVSGIKGQGMKKNGEGFYEIGASQIPSLETEAYRPPSKSISPWLLFYLTNSTLQGDAYWKSEASDLYKDMLSQAKAGRLVSEKSKELVKGAKDTPEKIQRIYDFCVNEMANSKFGPKQGIDPAKLKKAKSEDKAELILGRGFGTPDNINMLFCALLRAAKIDARNCRLSNREGYRFSKILTSMDTVLPEKAVAVKDGDVWRFYDPGAKYLSCGTVDKNNQMSVALIADKNELILMTTQTTSSSYSKVVRKAELEMTESGSVSGLVRIEFHGYLAVDLKRKLNRRGPAARVEFAEKNLKDDFPGGTFSELSFDGIDVSDGPVVATFHVSDLPFSDAIGDRLIVQPSLFTMTQKVRFPQSQRVNDIYLNFGRLEEDKVEIALPAGFSLDEGSAPLSKSQEKIYRYEGRIALNKRTNTLIYSRTFEFSLIAMPSRYYNMVKGIFDFQYQQDQHALTFIRSNNEGGGASE